MYKRIFNMSAVNYESLYSRQ